MPELWSKAVSRYPKCCRLGAYQCCRVNGTLPRPLCGWSSLEGPNPLEVSSLAGTTCFNASCAGEPTISHFVLRCALGEMGSCAQQLYSTDESQSCLSTVWRRMLTHFSLRSWGFLSHVIADQHIWLRL